MSTPLVSTKFFTPPVLPSLVSRPRLIQKLDEGLQPGYRLTLISAPAGFGKTTLVSEWLHSRDLPFAWFTLDESDNDPVRFWRYVIASLQTIDNRLGKIVLPLLQSPESSPLEAVVSAVINDIASLKTQIILVLDDYHLIESKIIHGSINFLIDHQPSQLHLVVNGRADPPLQISRRRGRREICEIRAAELRFNNHEMALFFNDAMKLGLTAEDITILENRTEGWIVGVQMAALSLQGMTDKHAFIAEFSGDDRYIADYLVDEVLQKQPSYIKDFLLKTSVLRRLNAPLCDALTGQHNSQLILNELERANLFIVPLDNHREWFRYHLLFTELLRQNLHQTYGTEAARVLLQQASEWHKHNGLMAEAAQYALTAGDFNNAALLIFQTAPLMFYLNELTTLLNWADAFPRDILAAQPRLCIMFGWAANATGHPQQCERFLQIVEKTVGITVDSFFSGENRPADLPGDALGDLIEATVMKTRQAIDQLDLKRTNQLARRVLPYLTPERDKEPFAFNLPSALRSPLLFIMGLAAKYNCEIRVARELFTEAFNLANTTNLQTTNIHIVALAMGHLGELQVSQGQLHEAAATFQQALQIARENPEQSSAYFGISHVGMGNLFYEWNDLISAEKSLHDGIELGILWNSWECLVPGYLGLSHLRQAQGDLQGAFSALDELIRRTPKDNRTVNLSAESFRALLWVKQGNLDWATSWVKNFNHNLKDEIPYLYESSALILVRVLFALKKLDEAENLIESLLEDAQREELLGRVIEILGLKALVLYAQGKREQAYAVLSQALSQAQPHGYIRMFVDEGEVIKRLLMDCEPQIKLSSPQLQPYVQKLLAAFSSSAAGIDTTTASTGTVTSTSLIPQPTKVHLEEPLSPREIEVLQLMASGASNVEIANKLYVTTNTVKKHITNIFRKLGVTSRIQAVELAHRLSLI